MSIRYIPKSQIIENKKSKFGEWVFKKSGIPYLGKYHLIKGQPFAGATFDPTKEQRPLQKLNESKLYKIILSSGLNSPAYLMALGNPGILNTLAPTIISSIPIMSNISSDSDDGGSIRVFVSKINQNPRIIKEVIENSPDHQAAIQNPFYKIVKIDFSEDVDIQVEAAEKEMPGIKTFLGL
jgi:hypothetical protein